MKWHNIAIHIIGQIARANRKAV